MSNAGTATTGRSAAAVRAEICQGLGYLGVTLEPQANAASAAVMSRGRRKWRFARAGPSSHDVSSSAEPPGPATARCTVPTGFASLPPPGLCDGIDGAEKIAEVIFVDQAPIGSTPRANAAISAACSIT